MGRSTFNPLVPAKAGTQLKHRARMSKFSLDSRFRGNERVSDRVKGRFRLKLLILSVISRP